MEESLYLKKQEEQERLYEARCLRCGACCGAGNDPCVNLAQESPDGRYYCRVYDHRIGQQSTVSGKSFSCVPIRDVFPFESPYPNCAYFIK